MTLLPVERTAPKADVSKEKILLYGAPKIGKSTFCAGADKAIFLATEQGLGHLDVFKVDIPDWVTLTAVLGEIAAGKHDYHTIVIDTIDNAWRFAEDYIRAKYGVDHESDLGYGKGWALISSEFTRVITKTSMLPYGLIMTSHSTQVDVDTRTGKVKRTVPTIPERGRKTILGMADMILFCDQTTVTENNIPVERRIIRTKPSFFWEAGDRTGCLPETIPLNYAAFLQAYQQAVTAKTDKKGETA